MKVTQSPSGDFFIATHGKLAVFDRDRDVAMARLVQAIWPMPPPPYFEEAVSAPRVRPSLVSSRSTQK